MGWPSLVTNLEQSLFALLNQSLLPHLIARFANKHSINFLLLCKEMDDVLALSSAVHHITEILFQRKLAESMGDNVDAAFGKPLEDNLLHRSLMEIFILHERVALMNRLLHLFVSLVRELAVGFAPLMPLHGPSEVVQRYTKLRSTPGPQLPESLQPALLIGDFLSNMLSAKSQHLSSKVLTAELAISDIANFFLLPLTALAEKAHETMKERLFIGKPLKRI